MEKNKEKKISPAQILPARLASQSEAGRSKAKLVAGKGRVLKEVVVSDKMDKTVVEAAGLVKKHGRIMKGTVVSDKMNKTVVEAAGLVKKHGRIMKGTVVSDKMDKTVVVAVTRLKRHPKYKKRYKVTKKYKAHDEKNESKIGDKVTIQECRPISKDKRWRVIKP